MKSLTFLTSSERGQITEELEEEAANILDVEDQPCEEPSPPKVPRGERKLLHLLEDIIHSSSTAVSPETSASEKSKREIARFIADEDGS